VFVKNRIMKYILDNLIIDNLWIFMVPLFIIIVGVIIEAIEKGLNNLTRKESAIFYLAIVVLLIILSGII